jgi:TRAP-type C4-dicarboxylate transport system permease large subunit
MAEGIARTLLGVTDDIYLLLLLLNLLLLLIGMFLDAGPAILVLGPVLAPIFIGRGVDPVHFGVILVLNMMIGLVTPPVGLCLYVVAGIAKVPIAEIARELGPYLLALLGVLGLVTYVPAVSTWLPQALGLGVVR